MTIAPFDLSAVVSRLEEPLLERWRDLLRSTSFVGGAAVQEFESAFASFLEVPGCVGVANGTDALVLALRALDIQPGDEVLVPAFTFFATAEAVVWAGAVPRIVDVEARTLNIDVEHAETLCNDRTRGAIGVHLFGLPFDVEGLRGLCRRRDLWMVEDAAQAHGARYGGRRVGAFGELATWSFYPSKNLGCFGDGGAVTGPDPGRLARVRTLANHGRTAHYQHGEVGTNSRLDALQAAVLSLRLATLEAENARRTEIAGSYREALGGLPGVRLLEPSEGSESVHHQFALLTRRRDELQNHLADLGIGTGIHYPLALHQQPALQDFRDDVPRPVAERAAREILCLPIHSDLSDDQVARVSDGVRTFF